MKILIIEDEQELARSIGIYLTEEGYVCSYAHMFAEAMEIIRFVDFDCILLDLMLPGGDGFIVLEELKRLKKHEGVIIISAKNSLDDKIKGLRIGADDYLSKPFHLQELGARVFSLIRRRQLGNFNVIEKDELKIDVLAKEASVKGHKLDLTKKEFALLMYFISNANRVISKVALAEHISGNIAAGFDSFDFVYTHIKNLKRKLSEAGYDKSIKTIYGSGYKWDA